MFKVPDACMNHDDAVLIGTLCGFEVAKRASGLYYSGDSFFGGYSYRVREGKKRVRGHYRAESFFARLRQGYAGRPYTVHLSRADAQCSPVFGQDDGVRLDVFDNLPGKL